MYCAVTGPRDLAIGPGFLEVADAYQGHDYEDSDQADGELKKCLFYTSTSAERPLGGTEQTSTLAADLDNYDDHKSDGHNQLDYVY